MLASNADLVDDLLANMHRLCLLYKCDVRDEYRIEQCGDKVGELNLKLVRTIRSQYPELADSDLYDMLIDAEYSSELFCDKLTKLLTSLLDGE